MSQINQLKKKKKVSKKNDGSQTKRHSNKNDGSRAKRHSNKEDSHERKKSKKAERADLLPKKIKDSIWLMFKRAGRQDIGFKEFVHELDLDIEESRQLRQFLKAQVRAGAVETHRRGRFKMALDGTSNRSHRIDTLSRSSRMRKQEGVEESDRVEEFLEALEVDAFSDEVLAEANRVACLPLGKELEDRLDLRDVPLFTIDGAYAKDFDDAVGIYQRDDKGCHVVVAIADVAHYVEEGSVLDLEAARRATSVYLPGQCYPMLPEALSNGMCSLRPDEDRLGLAAILHYNNYSQLIDFKVHEVILRSHARFTYGQVGAFLALDENPSEEPTDTSEIYPKVLEFQDDLKCLAKLTKKLRQRRFEHGALALDIPEPSFIFDENNEIKDIKRTERNQAHFLVEELMLQANEAIASFLIEHNLPGIFRNHGLPSQEKLLNMLEVVRRFKTPSLDAHLGHFQPHIGDDPEELTPQFFAALFDDFEGHPAQPLFQQMLLRCMQQAVYSENNEGHFGLSLKRYLHFTSPIRRYPDLCVHRSLKTFLRGQFTKRKREEMHLKFADLAAHSSVRERMAMKAERASISRAQAMFIESHIGEEQEGVISSITPFGFFVTLDNYFVEGLIHIRQLRGHYMFDELDMALVAPRSGERFSLGDRLRISIENASPNRGQIDFSLLERLPAA